MNSILIGRGHVFHSRSELAKHSFRYPTFFLYFRCDQEQELLNQLKKRFFGLISFSGQKYLKNEIGPVGKTIKKFLKEKCNYETGTVWLHTMPKMLGYAFNPVSFWICKRDDKIDAVLVEVNNTFGERHFYWIHPETGIDETTWYKAEKVFHVSPFFPIDGFYQFRFQVDDKQSRIDINFFKPNGDLRLATWVSGQFSYLLNQNVYSIFGSYGWMTPLVVIRIHLQAVKLWIKKCQFYRKPALPQQEVSS